MANVYDAGSTQILPMISVRKRNGNTNPEGLAQMRAILQERMKKCAPKLQLVPDIFETQELVDELCSKTGGYVRSLMLAVQYLSTEIDALPINERALLLCFSRQRNERRIAVDDHWDTLALIAMTKEIKNDDASRQLLFNRCILQYADVNDMGEVQEWYNIDPLIVGIPQFQEAMRKLSNPSQV
jgi:hypothetical protein